MPFLMMFAICLGLCISTVTKSCIADQKAHKEHKEEPVKK